jgi:hypothetical protein
LVAVSRDTSSIFLYQLELGSCRALFGSSLPIQLGRVTHPS